MVILNFKKKLVNSILKTTILLSLILLSPILTLSSPTSNSSPLTTNFQPPTSYPNPPLPILDINSYQYLKLEIENNIEFQITKDSRSQISNFDVFSYFFPQTFQESQYLNSYKSNFKDYKILNNTNIQTLNFNYNKNELKKFNLINNKFILESTITSPKIRSKVIFPIQNVSEENQKYLKFVGLIDTNDKIRIKAAQLAEGEDDLFIIASKIAQWLQKDIEYDLSTITELPNQKSTEVFETKRGVCKEVSNLFISMMRGLGIPARVVTGYAYTNSQEIIDLVGSNWGGHAWVEVLIGDKWVPFDLTYNQYGYVDATHIILDKSIQIRATSVQINATGYGFSLVKNSLNVNNSFKILDQNKNKIDDGFNLEIEGPNKLGFNSYGYLKVKIKNENNFYKILFLRLTKVKEVELLGNFERMIIFRPNESKEIYFKYKINDSLSSGYIYTFPFQVYNDFLKIDYNVSVEKKYPILKESDLPIEKEDNAKKYSNNKLDLKCNFLINSLSNTLICSIQNKNNFAMNNIAICFDEKICSLNNLNVNEKKDIIFKTKKYDINLSYFYGKISDEINIKFDKPKLSFKENLFENNLEINSFITNFNDDVILNIYVNDRLEKSISKQDEIINLKLVEEKNIIKLELKYNEIIFDTKELNITINKKYLPNILKRKIIKVKNNSERDLNPFEKLLKRFLNLISKIF